MKFISRASAEFWGLYNELPEQVQTLAKKQFRLFSENPFHPSLRLKPIGHFWSVRVSGSYRAIAIREGEEFFWFWIGSHKQYEELLKAAM